MKHTLIVLSDRVSKAIEVGTYNEVQTALENLKTVLGALKTAADVLIACAGAADALELAAYIDRPFKEWKASRRFVPSKFMLDYMKQNPGKQDFIDYLFDDCRSEVAAIKHVASVARFS